MSVERPSVPELDAILGEKIPVLDHGFVRVIDYMGDDAAVVQAARVSYGKGTKSTSQDSGLIRYLMRHRHTTPFEMCELKLHVKLPIFVARQWIRHRTANVNEYSARYSILDKEFYLPDPEHMGVQSKENHQGRAEMVSADNAEKMLSLLKQHGEGSHGVYEKLLDDNLARELARMALPLNAYTQWYWKIDLHNLLHFLALRADKHAQYEIRVYADAIMDVVKRWVPMVVNAFEEYMVGGFTLSATMIKVVQRIINGEAVVQEDSGLSPREWRELTAVIHPLKQ